MVTTLAGLVGGLLGSIAMTVAATAFGDRTWPSAVVWAMYLGDGDPASYETPGLAVHLVYGALAGVVFAALVGEPSTLGDALLSSVAWAAVLALVAVGLWLHVLIGAEPDAESLARLSGLHLVYGMVLALATYAVSGL